MSEQASKAEKGNLLKEPDNREIIALIMERYKVDESTAEELWRRFIETVRRMKKTLEKENDSENPHALEHLEAAEFLRSTQTETQASTFKLKKQKWTLMFFFASDNTLSPSTLSEIKAIKAAGSQIDTNVLVYFDPNENGAPTRVLEINKDQAPTIVSDDNSGDSVFSLLLGDYVNPEEIRNRGPQSKEFAASLQLIERLKADTALELFLRFCGEAYPAEHYMLFLVGHGLVVGRDAFLPDDNPNSAIGLKTLGRILNDFKAKAGKSLELIGMHGCSMSAAEVAYELKGTARYMLASQGLSFVGSWPYRHLLTKIYHDVGKGEVNVSEMVKSLHTLCIKYSVDFMHAGYSSDLCLSSLDSDRIDALTGPISKLSHVLESGLADPRCRDLIVLAHWKSQSYWQETYTDLYDFCLCLSQFCQEPSIELRGDKEEGRRVSDLNKLEIIEACTAVMNMLKPENGRRGDGPVVCADYVGADVQYSHGLSIYFPWSPPLEDDNDHVIRNYENYAFTSSFGHQNWLRFLDAYFMKTMRPDRIAEEERTNGQDPAFRDPDFRRWLDTARNAFPGEVALGSRDFVPTSVLEGKITAPASGGGACTCASTKNYSRVFSMSPGAWDQYSTKVKRKAE